MAPTLSSRIETIWASGGHESRRVATLFVGAYDSAGSWRPFPGADAPKNPGTSLRLRACPGGQQKYCEPATTVWSARAPDSNARVADGSLSDRSLNPTRIGSFAERASALTYFGSRGARVRRPRRATKCRKTSSVEPPLSASAIARIASRMTNDRFACGHPSSRSASTIRSAAATSSGRRLAATTRYPRGSLARMARRSLKARLSAAT